MNQLVFWVLVAAAVFVFQGDPNLWDVWHAKAMQAGQAK